LVAAPPASTVIHRSLTAIEQAPVPGPVRVVDDGDLLAALVDPAARLETVAERPAFWQMPGRWQSEWRQQPWHLVILVVAGRLMVERPELPTATLGAGGLLWLQPGDRHRLGLEHGAIHFLRFRIARGGRVLAGARPRLAGDALHLLPLFQLASDDLRFGHPRLGERLRAVLTLLASDGETRAAADPFPPAARRRIADLLDDPQRVRGLRASQLARLAGMPERSFTRAFGAAYGASPRRWLADQRLRLAAQHLLVGGQTVEAVAAWAGFANPSQFARRFRALFGCSPSAWRERSGG
jgi:AraC-like DNA-binding protein